MIIKTEKTHNIWFPLNSPSEPGVAIHEIVIQLYSNHDALSPGRENINLIAKQQLSSGGPEPMFRSVIQNPYYTEIQMFLSSQNHFSHLFCGIHIWMLHCFQWAMAYQWAIEPRHSQRKCKRFWPSGHSVESQPSTTIFCRLFSSVVTCIDVLHVSRWMVVIEFAIRMIELGMS